VRRISASAWGLLAILVATLLAATGCLPTPPRPRVVAALGDSITRGFDSCGPLAECPQVSWATGTDPGVLSHLSRLAGGARLAAYNDAITGAASADLFYEAQQAVRQRADYVIVLIGANDVCTDTERQMTPSAVFGSRVRAALTYLHDALPGVRIFVASVPDVHRLWQVASVVPKARMVWQVARVCQSMLANPLSRSTADIARRGRVQHRVADNNAALHQACVAVAGIHQDDASPEEIALIVANARAGFARLAAELAGGAAAPREESPA